MPTTTRVDKWRRRAHGDGMFDATICGHDRATLRKSLEFANTLDLDGISRGWSRPDDSAGALLFDVHDPAKLAAIIAELLCERGVQDLSESEFADVLEVRVRAYGDHIMIARRLPDMHKIGGPLLEMPQARAFALALLNAPNATMQDIERIIGEVTMNFDEDDWSDDDLEDYFDLEFEDDAASLRGTSQCDGRCDPQCDWCLVGHHCPDECAGGPCPYETLDSRNSFYGDQIMIARSAQCLCQWEAGDSPCPIHGEEEVEPLP